MLTIQAFSLISCTEPCRELAERICECQFNARSEAACLLEVDNRDNLKDPSDEENQRCSELLETCSCDARERDLAACGESNPITISN